MNFPINFIDKLVNIIIIILDLSRLTIIAFIEFNLHTHTHCCKSVRKIKYPGQLNIRFPKIKIYSQAAMIVVTTYTNHKSKL